jgi:hypothetical protein
VAESLLGLTLKAGSPILFPMEHVSLIGLSSTSQFVSELSIFSYNPYGTLQNENLWDFNKSYAAGGESSLRCLFPPLLPHTRALLL